VPTFLIDENLPRSLAPQLRVAGMEAQDVRDLGLRGKPDSDILELSIAQGLVLVTSDVGFASLLRSHPRFPGMVVARLPNEWSTQAVNEVIARSLQGLLGQGFTSTLIVIEPDRIRVRRLW
jgi:predicted nuclease of predicted toxin-antitoxin system